MTDIARTGAPKKTQTSFESKQTHTARPATADMPGLLAHGISRTQAAELLGESHLNGPVNSGVKIRRR